MYVAQEKPC